MRYNNFAALLLSSAVALAPITMRASTVQADLIYGSKAAQPAYNFGTVITAQQQQTAPRKYIIRPLNLGTNTEIRARSSRNIQVQVTDENDRPLPDVPLLFLLAGALTGSGSAGAIAGQLSSIGAASATGQATGVAGQAAGLAGQTSLRVLTNPYGIANVEFTANDLVGNLTRLQIQVEGTNTMWEGALNIAHPEAIIEPPQQSIPEVYEGSIPSLTPEDSACLALINKFREENFQPPVQVSVRLTNAAQWLSRDNADNNPDNPSHTDSLGRDLGKRLADFGYRGGIIKENIVVGADTAVTAMGVWKGSGFHIRNLLNSDVKMIGVSRSCNKGAKSGCHWTVILGSIMDQTIP